MSEQENKPQTTKLGRFVKLTLATSLILGVVLLGIVSMEMASLRELIMGELSQMTGLPIEIESLNLSLSNGLSLRGRGLKVGSKDGSQQIFSAQDLFLDAELEPLLTGQLKIKKIMLVKPTMDIVLESKPNSIGLPDTPESTETHNQRTPFQSDKVESPEPLEIPEPGIGPIESIRNLFKNQSLSLRTVEIKDAKLIFVRSRNNLLPAKKIPMLLSARFDLTSPVPNQINIDGKLSHVEVEGLGFKGTLKASDLLAENIPINVDLKSTFVSAKKINALAETLVNSEITPVKFESGKVKKMFVHFEGLINPKHNSFKQILLRSGFEISDLETLIPGNEKLKNVTLSHIDGEGIWQNGILNYKINGMLMDGSIRSSIVVNLPDALKGSFIGTLNSDTKLEGLNLASVEFNLPDRWTPTTGTVNGSIKVQGPLTGASAIHSHGKLEINDLSLGIETLSTVKQVTLIFSQKTPRQTLARVQLKDLLLNNISINTVSTKLKFSPEKFSFGSGRIVPSNGVILFSGDYRPRPNAYVIRINGNKLRLEDFLKEQMEGSGLFRGMFQGNLNTAQTIQQKGDTVLFSHVADSLSGKLSVEFRDGGINSSLWVIDELLPLLNPMAAVTAQRNGLNYDTLTGDFKVWKGETTTDNFELKGPQIDFTALAAANLVTGKLDGEIKVMPMQLLNNTTKATPLFGNIFKGGLKDMLAETYFKLDGTLEKPKLFLTEGKTLFGEPANTLDNLAKTPR